MVEIDRPVVLILGMFHFAGSADLVSVTEDMLSPRRQKEILELVEKLEAWRPTKIAVEAMPGDEELKRRFEELCANGLELSPNEIEQVGFRVAQRLGLRRLFGIDADATTAIASVQREADPAVMARLLEWGQRMKAEEEQALGSSTLVEYLRRANSPSFLNGTQEYLDELLMVGVGTTFSGAELATSIYRRNLRIFANLRSVVDGRDRVLVLIGSSHARALHEYLGVWNHWTVVDPLEVL